MQNSKTTDFCDHEIQILSAVVLIDMDGNHLGNRLHFQLCKEPEKKDFQVEVPEKASEYLGSKKQITDLEEQGVIFNENFPKNKAAFRRIMLEGYHAVKKEKIYLPQGVVQYNENIGCVLGEEIICPQKYAGVKFYAGNSFHLHDTYKNGNELSDIISFAQIDDSACPLLVMYTTFSVLQGYLPFFGIKERFILILEGKTSSFKSTLAKLAGNIFKENTVLTLVSSKAAIQELLSGIGNVPVVLDDYNKSSFAAAIHEKGRTLSEIIQAYPDRNTVQKMDGRQVSSYQIQPGLIVTAEEMFTNPSTLNRCLIAVLEDDIHPKTLERFQKDKAHIFSWLVYNLNRFIINNLEPLKKAITANFHIYRTHEANMPYEPSTVAGYYRINTTYSLSMATIDVFRYFLMSMHIGNGIIDNVCNVMTSAVKSSCNALCDRLCDKKLTHQHIDAIAYLHFTRWSYTDSVKKLYSKPYKYIGVTIDGVLYIKGNVLINELKKYELNTTKKALSNELVYWGLLEIDSDGKRSVHLPGEIHHRERFYGIRIDLLLDLYNEMLNNKYQI